MEWFETVINAVLFVTVIGGLIVERKWTKNINNRLDAQAKQITSAMAKANTASVNANEAKRVARAARQDVSAQQVVVPPLPDTPHNESLVAKLRAAAHKQDVKRAAAQIRSREAHPAGKRLPGFKVTGSPVQTTQSGIDYIPVAAAIALTTDTSSSYSDTSSSSSSSYDSGSSSSSSSDSGSFGGGDSGSF